MTMLKKQNKTLVGGDSGPHFDYYCEGPEELGDVLYSFLHRIPISTRIARISLEIQNIKEMEYLKDTPYAINKFLSLELGLKTTWGSTAHSSVSTALWK